MNKSKQTRRALHTSLLSLLLCVSMLLGTTFAWFTDSVASTGNIIKSGTLDVEMSWSDTKDGTYKDASEGPIFDYKLWEPGFTQTKYIKVENKGDLAFQYQMRVIPNNMLADGTKLAEVIDVYCAIVDDGSTTDFAFTAPGRDAATNAMNYGSLVKLGTLKDLMLKANGVDDGVLLPEDGKGSTNIDLSAVAGEKYVGNVTVCLALHMQEEAGNEYQNLSIGDGFKVELLAAQMTYEMDSFDAKYDQTAAWPVTAAGSGSFATTGNSSNFFTVTIKDLNDQTGNPNNKVATALINKASVETDESVVTINIAETKTNSNIALTSDQTAKTYDITANGLKTGNTNPIKVEMCIAKGLTGVKLYHYDAEVTTYSYDPNSGVLAFETLTFSPFTIVYDIKAVEVEQPENGNGLPVAVVTEKPELVNSNIEWGNYGQWSPTEGLDANLEAAYEFACKDTADEAKASAYANWYCDFYVKLDKDLAANQIFLGGNYGDFGWIGFHNGDLTLDANTELPLLGSVTSSPWTYADVASFVGTFTCGVGDVDDALAGATFTVMLRLTNPENENEFYNVSTIEHKFTKSASNEAELSGAIEAGETAIELAAGTYKMPSSPKATTIKITGTKDAVVDLTMGAYMDNASVSFEGITIKTGTGMANGNGSDYAAMYTPNVTYTNCTFVGPMRVGRDGAKFINCTFTELGNDYIWTYGNDVTFEGCTFESNGKAILIYSDGGSEVSKVDVTGCIFNATTGAKAGAIANQNCAAIEIHNYGNGVNLTTSDNTVDNDFSGEWRIKTYETGKTKVIVNGVEYTQIALDGKLMTIDAEKNVTVL